MNFTHIITHGIRMPYVHLQNAQGKQGYEILKIEKIDPTQELVHALFREDVEGLIRETKMVFTMRTVALAGVKFVSVPPGVKFVYVPTIPRPSSMSPVKLNTEPAAKIVLQIL